MPADSTTDSDGPGLVYEDALPLAWQALDEQALAAGQLASLNAANAETLRAILSIEHSISEHGEHDAAVNAELCRLELKVDLLTYLLGQLLSRESPLPPGLPVRLSGRGIAWTGKHPTPAPGSMILVTLYLSQKYPKPIELPARVSAVEPQAGGSAEVRAVFADLSERLRDDLERLVFLYDRRRIAQSRGR